MGRPKGSTNRKKTPALAEGQFIYEVTCLNLPNWMTFSKNDNPNQVKIRKTRGILMDGRFNEKKGEFERASQGDKDEVLTPENEEVLLIEPKSGYSTHLTLQDIGRFREWREYDGPKYDAEGLKVNARVGEPMSIGTRKDWDSGTFRVQPWAKKLEPVSPAPSTETMVLKEMLTMMADMRKEIADLKAEKK